MVEVSDSFVHLHVHTEYSLLDGAVRIGKLMESVKAMGMTCVALTDHGNLYGAVEFYQAAAKAGIKPILGCEVYLAPAERSQIKPVAGRRDFSHLTLLAETNTGWGNLVKLVSAAHLDQVTDKPRVDKELLREFSEGIICLSGDKDGEINELLLSDRPEEARRSVQWFLETYGQDHFFLEVQDHGLDSQSRSLAALREMGREFEIGLVATNDVHFLKREDHEGHDVMVCIGEGEQVDTQNRVSYSSEVYLKTPTQMRKLFTECPEACENTVKIAERCHVTMELDPSSIAKYPKFQSPDGSPLPSYFRKLCQEGLLTRYGPERVAADEELHKRLNFEIDLMERMGFLSYFLIVWDFIKWARDNDIPVGPGRGSAAGSLVAYVLRITDVCPLTFDLVFERFLNPDRVSPPDVDIDFCTNRRDEVIDYVRKKYGERQVAHIITFGSMGAKSVIRDVGRVLGISYGETDRIAKMVPTEVGITLNYNEKKKKQGAIDVNLDLKRAVAEEPGVGRLWQFATYLEGLSRNAGVHASAVVIADRPIDDFVPLSRGSGGEVLTQYAMGPITDVGLLKMDFLGLKNLTIIENAVRLIRKKQPDFDLGTIPYDDSVTFAMLRRGETKGVFQMESEGMAQTCRQLKPDALQEIIALIAIYRPGPMQYIPSFTARKNRKETVIHMHPLLEGIGKETFGILIYQEQVQQAASILAGYTLGQADLLRRAMGKKKPEEMAIQRGVFVKGCLKTNGIEADEANGIFDVLEKFAEYGFNKSHSAAYGIVTYRTAWLKANYPVEFLSAILSNELSNTDKIGFFIDECRRMKIKILPPDVNDSGLDFTPASSSKGMAIRFGLAGIKNVGTRAMEALIEEREAGGKYEGLDDCVRRVDTQFLNKKTLESLIKCGAFDFIGEPRHRLMGRINGVVEAAISIQRDAKSGQANLFDVLEFESAPTSLSTVEEVAPWTEKERLDFEKELTGFYISGHPLGDYEAQISDRKRFSSLADLPETEKRRGDFAGLVDSVSVKFAKKDNRAFAVFQIEDFTGRAEVVAWSDAYEKSADFIKNGLVVKIRAKIDIDQRTETKRLILDKMDLILPDTPAQKGKFAELQLAVDEEWDGGNDIPVPHAAPPRKGPRSYCVLFQSSHDTAQDLRVFYQLLSASPGQTPIDFLFRKNGRDLLIREAMHVKLTDVTRTHIKNREVRET